MDLQDVNTEGVKVYSFEELDEFIKTCMTEVEFTRMTKEEKYNKRLLCSRYLEDPCVSEKYSLKEFLTQKKPEWAQMFPDSPKVYSDPEPYDEEFCSDSTSSDESIRPRYKLPCPPTTERKLTLEEQWDLSDAEHERQRAIDRALNEQKKQARGQGVRRKRQPPKKRSRKKKASKPKLKPAAEPSGRKRKNTTQPPTQATRAKTAAVTRSQTAAQKTKEQAETMLPEHQTETMINEDLVEVVLIEEQDKPTVDTQKSETSRVIQKTEATDVKTEPKVDTEKAGPSGITEKAGQSCVTEKAGPSGITWKGKAKYVTQKTKTKYNTEQTEAKIAIQKAKAKRDIQRTCAKPANQKSEAQNGNSSVEYTYTQPPKKKRPSRAPVLPPAPPCFYNEPPYKQREDYKDLIKSRSRQSDNVIPPVQSCREQIIPLNRSAPVPWNLIGQPPVSPDLYQQQIQAARHGEMATPYPSKYVKTDQPSTSSTFAPLGTQSRISFDREKRIQPQRKVYTKFIVPSKPRRIIISEKKAETPRSGPLKDITKLTENRENIIVSTKKSTFGLGTKGQGKRPAQIESPETTDVYSSADIEPIVKKSALEKSLPSEKRIKLPPHVKPCPTHYQDLTLQTGATVEEEITLTPRLKSQQAIIKPELIPPSIWTQARKGLNISQKSGKSGKLIPAGSLKAIEQTKVKTNRASFYEAPIGEYPPSQASVVQAPLVQPLVLKRPVIQLPHTLPHVIRSRQKLITQTTFAIQAPIMQTHVIPTQVKQPDTQLPITRAQETIGTDDLPLGSSSPSDKNHETITIEFPPCFDQSKIDALTFAEVIDLETSRSIENVKPRQQVCSLAAIDSQKFTKPGYLRIPVLVDDPKIILSICSAKNKRTLDKSSRNNTTSLNQTQSKTIPTKPEEFHGTLTPNKAIVPTQTQMKIIFPQSVPSEGTHRFTITTQPQATGVTSEIGLTPSTSGPCSFTETQIQMTSAQSVQTFGPTASTAQTPSEPAHKITITYTPQGTIMTSKIEFTPSTSGPRSFTETHKKTLSAQSVQTLGTTASTTRTQMKRILPQTVLSETAHKFTTTTQPQATIVESKTGITPTTSDSHSFTEIQTVGTSASTTQTETKGILPQTVPSEPAHKFAISSQSQATIMTSKIALTPSTSGPCSFTETQIKPISTQNVQTLATTASTSETQMKGIVPQTVSSEPVHKFTVTTQPQATKVASKIEFTPSTCGPRSFSETQIKPISAQNVQTLSTTAPTSQTQMKGILPQTVLSEPTHRFPMTTRPQATQVASKIEFTPSTSGSRSFTETQIKPISTQNVQTLGTTASTSQTEMKGIVPQTVSSEPVHKFTITTQAQATTVASKIEFTPSTCAPRSFTETQIKPISAQNVQTLSTTASTSQTQMKGILPQTVPSKSTHQLTITDPQSFTETQIKTISTESVQTFGTTASTTQIQVKECLPQAVSTPTHKFTNTTRPQATIVTSETAVTPSTSVLPSFTETQIKTTSAQSEQILGRRASTDQTQIKPVTIPCKPNDKFSRVPQPQATIMAPKIDKQIKTTSAQSLQTFDTTASTSRIPIKYKPVTVTTQSQIKSCPVKRVQLARAAPLAAHPEQPPAKKPPLAKKEESEIKAIQGSSKPIKGPVVITQHKRPVRVSASSIQKQPGTKEQNMRNFAEMEARRNERPALTTAISDKKLLPTMAASSQASEYDVVSTLAHTRSIFSETKFGNFRGLISQITDHYYGLSENVKEKASSDEKGTTSETTPSMISSNLGHVQNLGVEIDRDSVRSQTLTTVPPTSGISVNLGTYTVIKDLTSMLTPAGDFQIPITSSWPARRSLSIQSGEQGKEEFSYLKTKRQSLKMAELSGSDSTSAEDWSASTVTTRTDTSTTSDIDEEETPEEEETPKHGKDEMVLETCYTPRYNTRKKSDHDDKWSYNEFRFPSPPLAQKMSDSAFSVPSDFQFNRYKPASIKDRTDYLSLSLSPPGSRSESVFLRDSPSLRLKRKRNREILPEQPNFVIPEIVEPTPEVVETQEVRTPLAFPRITKSCPNIKYSPSKDVSLLDLEDIKKLRYIENRESQEDETEYDSGGYMPINIGDELRHQYKVCRKLGWGHFSTVWLCKNQHENGPRYVALKICKSAPMFTAVANDEIRLLQETKSVNPNHVGYRNIVQMVDTFKLISENGVHTAISLEIMGPSLLHLLMQSDFRGIQVPAVRRIIFQVLRGLTYLHEECHIIHTDIKPENILIKVDENYIRQIVGKMERFSELGVELPRSYVSSEFWTDNDSNLHQSDDDIISRFGGPRGSSYPNDIYLSELVNYRERHSQSNFNVPMWVNPNIEIKIADLGNACWVDHHFSHEIQTRQYRALEVITGAGYSYPADMWSVGCMAFELATGEMLFSPKGSTDLASNVDHLCLIWETLGGIPRYITETGTECRKFFQNGQLKDVPVDNLRIWKIEDVIVEKYKWKRLDAIPFAGFLESLVEPDPALRATASQALTNEWLLSTDI